MNQADLQDEKVCAVPASGSSHFATGGGGTTQKYFPMNESLLLLIYLVKTVSSLWQAAKTNYLLKEIFSF